MNLFSTPLLVCFDGDDAPSMTPPAAPVTPPAAPVTPPASSATPPTPSQDETFNQEDLNRFLAEDRRKHQEKYKTLEAGYQEILADKTLATEQRERLEGELSDLQKSFRTKEQQAEFDRKQQKNQFEEALTEQTSRGNKWESMYKEQVVHTALQDAAIKGEAFNSAQIIGLLKPMSQLKEETTEDGKSTGRLVPMIEFSDIDEKTGDPITTLRTPAEAVQRMKELPEQFGNLFRANVVAGVGQGAATGGAAPGEGGNVDVTKLSSEQYRELRKTNPELLGLRRRN